MKLDSEFLSILRCPESRAKLVEDGGRLVSVDPRTRRAYRLEDGEIPILVVEESTTLDETEWRAVMERAGGAAGR